MDCVSMGRSSRGHLSTKLSEGQLPQSSNSLTGAPRTRTCSSESFLGMLELDRCHHSLIYHPDKGFECI